MVLQTIVFKLTFYHSIVRLIGLMVLTFKLVWCVINSVMFICPMGLTDITERTVTLVEVKNMVEVPLKWTSRVIAHSSFNEAFAAIKKPDTKVVYGLQEAQMLLMNEAEIEDESKTHFYIVGNAINATTTQNLHKYLAEELEVSAETLTGKPVMVDHAKGSLNNAGKVLVTSWESHGVHDGAITYVARIRKSHPVAEAVALGDIDTVSVGAIATSIECSVCGDDMYTCSHRLGKTYEVEDKQVLATAIGRGLKFRELSITPFPADEHASAYVTTDSISTAMNVWIESSESKPKLFGEKTKMSEDHKDESVQSEEFKRKEKELEERIAQLTKENTEKAKVNAELRSNEVNDLVDQVIGIGISANLYESDDIDTIKESLRELSAQTLREKLSDYKRVLKLMDKPIDVKSTAVVEEKVIEQTPKKSPLTYTKKEMKGGLREVMGNLRTSPYAEKIMQGKIAFDTYNPMRDEYVEIFTENSRNARRNE